MPITPPLPKGAVPIQSGPPPLPPGAEPIKTQEPTKPEIPIGEQPASLGGVTRVMGKQAYDALPYIGAGAATLMAPEAMLPAMGYAAAGGGAGEAIKQGLASALRRPEAPKSLGEAAQNIGTSAAEQGAMELGGRALVYPIKKAFGRFFDPRQWYQSALMPPAGSGAKNIGRQVAAGIEGKIPVSEEGHAMAQQAWRDLNQQIGNIIAKDPQKPVEVEQVLKNLDALKDKWSRGSGDPAFVNAVDQVRGNFLMNHKLLNPGSSMSGESAQAAKKGLYEEIRLSKQGAWKEGGGPNPLSVQAKQEIADGLRTELQNTYPEIGALNRKEGAYIELEKSLNRFVAREANKRMTPYFAVLGAVGSAIGGSLTGHPAAGAEGAAMLMGTHFLRAAIEDPEVKSKIAMALAKAGKSAIGKATKAFASQAPILAPNLIRLGTNAITEPEAITPPQK